MKRENLTLYLIGALILVIIIIAASGLYRIDMTQQVVITQFGKPVGDAINEPGLHFKVPFIQDVNYFEKRLLEWDGNPTEISAKDKKFIEVDTYARWRIADPLKFFRSVVNENGAQTRLDNVIEAATRNLITSNVLIEVVRNSSRKMQVAEAELALRTDELPDSIKAGWVKIAAGIFDAAAEKVREYGIELMDVRIKRINYIEDVRRKVFERMIAERLRIAEKFRSEGMGKKAEIEGEMEKELQRITSEAYRSAQEIKGKADAEAIKIYARAYERDPDFYSLLKVLNHTKVHWMKKAG
ncbi:MAG: protease modulator HflC [Bacteroidales bacterium]|nr:protease modulator HflC [Bacteroidales bacterium]